MDHSCKYPMPSSNGLKAAKAWQQKVFVILTITSKM